MACIPSERLALNSAASLGTWLRRELRDGASNDHLCRVITRETDRWFKNDLEAHEIEELVAAPAVVGDPHWDALLQGVVAWRLQAASVSVPEWATTARLDVAWAPYDATIRDDGWYTISVLNTPAAILDRGVVFDRNNLELV